MKEGEDFKKFLKDTESKNEDDDIMAERALMKVPLDL